MDLNGHSGLTDDIRERLRSRYGVNNLDQIAIDTDQKLAERIRVEADTLGKSIINQIPSRFEHQDPDNIEAIPQYQFPVWKTLSDNFEFFAVKGGVLWLQPAAWQFALAFHHIARKHRLFVAYGDTYNIPVAVEVSRQAKISCVVTNEKIVREFVKEMEVNKDTNTINLAMIARDVRDGSDTPAEFNLSGATTLWEIQVFPGHTIAYQSFGLTGEKNSFHLSEDYLWRFEEDATYITGLSPEVLPVLNYKLPVVVKPVVSKTILPAFSFIYA